MTRYPDWAARLERLVRANAARPFRYGEWDCCLFVCSAIEAMTGVDPAVRLRGKYRSIAEARQLVGSVRAVAEGYAAQLKMPEIGVMHARRGDLVLIERPRAYSLGLVALDGKHLLVAGARGIVKIPRIRACRAWMV